MEISACLITRNEEENLPRCLRSLEGIADEIVVVDSGSIDRTPKIAAGFGARVIHQDWLGYVGQKNFAINQAKFPWIFSIDGDEELSPELREAILALKKNPPSQSPAGYQVSRLVFYQGKWIRHGDWYPDRLVRLFQKDAGRFAGGKVHERLEIAGPNPVLPGHLHHFTYRDAADRAARIESYAQLWAESAAGRSVRASALTPWLRSWGRFLRGYLLKRGFLDGKVGWEIAAGNAREVYLKYQALRELTQSK